MLVNAQSLHKFDRFDQNSAMRKSPGSYHRRTVSCLAVASHHEHYNHPSYYVPNGRFYDAIDLAEGSASPVQQTRHAKRKSDGAISLEQLQKGLSEAGVNSSASAAETKKDVPAHMSRSRLSEQVAQKDSDRACTDSGYDISSIAMVAQAPKSLRALLQTERTHIISIFTIGMPHNQSLAMLLNQRKHDNHFECHCTDSHCSSVDYEEDYRDDNRPRVYRVLALSPRPRLAALSSNHHPCIVSSFSSRQLNVISPSNTPRRSLLSDLLNNQGTPSRLEQNANRRRMLKSMRRYSVDASEMDFSLGRPSTRVKPMQGIPSEEESSLLADGNQGFSATPTVRYLRNPCHAAVKTKLQPSAYRTLARRGGNDGEETPDYFGAEDRVW
ncbi:hypothetical protein EDD11_000031 [Mortierella claussenii]|nr:hypothetical protein EDD11_000031 [Mortierella claussenii]